MRLLLPIATLLSIIFFQAPTNPPMKLGLWESTGTSSVRQPDGTEKTSSQITRSCKTKENWLTLMGPTARNACPKTNEVWTKDSYSFNVACPGKPKMASASIHFDTPEVEHGSIDFSGMPDGSPFNMHGDFTDRWVSSDCGDVSPDHPVLVR